MVKKSLVILKKNFITFLKLHDLARYRMANLREHHSTHADAVRKHYHEHKKLFLIHL